MRDGYELEEILERFREELIGFDFEDVRKVKKYARLRGYIEALLNLLRESPE